MRAVVSLLVLITSGPQLKPEPPAKVRSQLQGSSLRLEAPPAAAHTGCLVACHTPHSAKGPVGRGIAASSESTCLSCHDDSAQPAAAGGADKKLTPTFGIGSSHVGLRIDRPRTRYVRELGEGARKEVLRQDCSGCHDVHGRDRGMLRRLAFDARGQLLKGIKPVFKAQICFGCHAGREAAPLGNSMGDLGRRFGSEALSSHFIGRSAQDRPDLPSLKGTEFKGRLDCTSCHDNPDPKGIRGPHGSPFPNLLKASFGKEQDAGFIGAKSDELCYTCHDRYAIASNSSFPLHKEHITGFIEKSSGIRRIDPERPLPVVRSPWDTRMGSSSRLMSGLGVPTPCATCHDPHGSTEHSALIQFDRSVVTRSSLGGVEFYRSGLGHGSCTLSCHGHDHIQSKY
jgi:predicted CXXCH cytochrome family protein